MNGRGFCINWKVVAGLAAVGLGIWLFAPGVVSAALPLLIFAVCPLSMVLMMRGMQGGHGGKCANQGQQATEIRDDLPVSDKVGQLKAQLARAQAEQDAVAREIVHLEREALTKEAEAVLAVGEPAPGENGQRPQLPTKRAEPQ